MKTKLKCIAYLAPELPSLSATFISNEIWGLEELGAEIIPYSVHQPGHPAREEKAQRLAARTEIIYNKSWKQNLSALFTLMFSHKRSFLKSLFYIGGDILKTGVFRKQSVKLLYQYLHACWLALDLRKHNVEHLHVHFAHVPTQIGMYAATLAGIPFTFMSHANDLFERPLLIPEKIKRSHKAVTISNFNIELMTRLGGDVRRMDIIRCGVNSEDMNRPTRSISGPIRIGSLGRLVEKKGMDTLIEAGVMLRSKGYDFKIEIAGDGPLKEALEAQAVTAGLTEHIHFLGALSHTQVFEWMQGLNAFVLAGKKDANGDMDGIPVVLMEAMSLGVPVLSTYLSGIPELVIHESTGLLSQPGDAASLAMNLERILRRDLILEDLKLNAQQRIKSEFDRGLNARRLLKIIHHSTFALAA